MRHAALVLVLMAAPVAAQRTMPESRAQRFVEDCDGRWSGRDRESFCEVRDATIKVPSRLTLDAGPNGSATFFAWGRNEVLVRSLIWASAETRSEAQAIARDIRVLTDVTRIRAEGPEPRRRTGWAVSYEIWVPKQMNIDAETFNGGIRVRGIEGRLDLRAMNGGIALREVNGDVRAETTNGSVTAELSGTTWKGAGLDLETTNGSVNLDIPKAYSADLETGTVNGGMNVDFPIMLQGSIGRRITTKLGQGGPRIRARTTNGSVRIRQLP